MTILRIARMRPFSTTYRIQPMSIAEIKTGLDDARIFIRRTLRMPGDSLNETIFMNALWTRFLDMSLEDQAKFISEGVERLAEIRSGPENLEGWERPEEMPPAGGTGGAAQPKLAVDQKKPEGKPRPKRQSGN
jgi:hypothetical protein